MRWLSVVLTVLVAAAVVGLPFAYRAVRSTTYRNFRVVEPGVLYRSGQMSPAGFARATREHGIRTVVCLRDSKDDAGVNDDLWESDYCAATGIGFRRFPLADWSPIDGKIPGAANVSAFLAVMADPAVPKPVLVHCFAGIHRTGPLVAAYRMERHGWTPAEAIEEMQAMGTVRTTFADNLLGFLRGYRTTGMIGGPTGGR